MVLTLPVLRYIRRTKHLMESDLKSFPYITQPQLLSLIEADYRIEVVAIAEPFRKSAVWYGEWVIQVPEQRGETDRFLVPARQDGAPRLRVLKTAYGVISLMQELGFREVGIPMEKGGTVSHRLGQKISSESEVRAAPADEPLSLETVKAGLLHLAQRGFTSVYQAIALIEAGFAKPVNLKVCQDGTWPTNFDVIRLTKSGRTTAEMIRSQSQPVLNDPDDIPDWKRVITEDYIHQKADDHLYATDIIHAKAWYTGPEAPEHKQMMQPMVRLRLPARKARMKGA